MTKIINYTFIFLFVGLGSLPLIAANETNEHLAEVLQANEVLAQAIKKGNDQTIANLLSDDLVYYNACGEFRSKQEHLDCVRSGKLVIHSYEPEDVTVHLYGPTAIVSQIIKVKRTWNGNMKGGETLRVTRIFVKENDRWRVVFGQNTLMKNT